MSDIIPERIIRGKGKSHFNYNIKEVVIEDIEGTPRTIYEYDYVIIEGEVTKAKIRKALENTKFDIEEEIDPDEIETTYTEAKSAIALSNIAAMSYTQLNTYIENNVTNFAEAKAYLKKLSKVVLAILKYQNVS